MGCVQSAPRRVEAATTLDEAARRTGKPFRDIVQLEGAPYNVHLSNNLELPNSILDEAAVASPSNDAPERPLQATSPLAARCSDRRSSTSKLSPLGPQSLRNNAQHDVFSDPVLPPLGTASRTAPPPQPPLPTQPTPQKQSPDTVATTSTGPEDLQAALPWLKDLLARISTPQPQLAQLLPQPPSLDNRWLTLIIWDIENVRCPRGNGPWDPVLTPSKVLGYIKHHFIYEAGRVEYRTVAAVTPKSLNIIRRKYSDFVDQMVPEMTLLVASSEKPKRSADVMLKKELYRFVSEHAHVARHSPGQLAVVLISGDEDFLEPVQVALNSGFAVELMHHEHPSCALRSQLGYARPPLLWQDFLKQRTGANHINLPYSRS